MFLLVSVILFTGGGVCYPSMHCSRSLRGVSAPGGRVSALGGVSANRRP